MSRTPNQLCKLIMARLAENSYRDSAPIKALIRDALDEARLEGAKAMQDAACHNVHEACRDWNVHPDNKPKAEAALELYKEIRAIDPQQVIQGAATRQPTQDKGVL